MNSSMDELRSWIVAQGYDFEPVLDCKTHRFATSEDSNGEKSGWYIGSSESGIVTLTVSNWRTDEKVYFRTGMDFTNEKKVKEFHESIKRQAEESEKEREIIQRQAAEAAKICWDRAPIITAHPYLSKKGFSDITGVEVRAEGDALLIPMRDLSGSLWGIQRIYGDGTKRFMYGQRIKGLSFKLSDRPTPDAQVCEGFATALSIFTATGIDTYVAFNAGNLREVACGLRDKNRSEKKSNNHILICGDDDRFKKSGNTGREKAEDAALACGGIVAFPIFPEGSTGTDFNDLMLETEVAEVRRQINEAVSSVALPTAPVNLPGSEEIASGEDSKEEAGPQDEKGKRAQARQIIKEALEDFLKNKQPTREVAKLAKNILNKVFYLQETPYHLAQEFLKDTGFLCDETCLLKYYRNDFYRFKETTYQKLDDEWLEDKVNRWLSSSENTRFAGTTKVSQVISLLKIRPMYIGGQIDLPAKRIDSGEFGDWITCKNIIPMKSGLLDVKEEKLTQSCPDYFFDYCLPFNYDPEAKCPTFDKICADIFSSPEQQILWEEIMGVHIYNPFLIEKMFLLLGIGANGKSVMTTILGCLLGNENISAVPIECFSPNNFAFINTLGKLANIIPDLKDVDQIDEGTLKAYISREEMSFNRKNKPIIKAKPTAFLTACTNVLPKFSDKTDGIWRRIILLDFKKQIPEEDRDPKFRDPEFWINSGELPGIFNRALGAAKRVERRGRILETEDAKASLEEYRQELNYTAQFIREWIEFEPYVHVPSHPVYEAFRQFVTMNGGKPCASKTFFHQLKHEAKILGKNLDVSKKTERSGNYVGKMLLHAKLTREGERLSIQRDTEY